jgi:hypothetical protein
VVESDTGKLALRIERGSVSEEELAALTAVLFLALAQRGEVGGDELSDVPLWRRERSGAAYRSPYHWR